MAKNKVFVCVGNKVFIEIDLVMEKLRKKIVAQSIKIDDMLFN